MPFLLPAIVAWVALGIGAMTYYFVSIAGRVDDRSLPSDGPIRPRPRVAAPVRDWSRSDAALSQPWRRSVAPSAVPPAPRFDFPAYDMEGFPADKWSQAS